MYSKKYKTKNLIVFILPLLLFYLLFFWSPMMGAIGYSFSDWNGLNPGFNLVGLKNYISILSDERFYSSAKFTISYTMLYLVIANILALTFALLLSTNMKTKSLLRSILFSPNVLNMATIGFMWQFVLGTIVSELYSMTHWGVFEISWLNNIDLVVFTITFVRIWVSVGYLMVIYIAGIQSIPRYILEAAEVDGAAGLKKVFYIIIPLLMPAVTINIFISLVNCLRIFPLIMTLTEGGPGFASESLSLNIYREAFVFGNFGYASAKAVIFTLFIFMITVVQLFIFKKKEVEI